MTLCLAPWAQAHDASFPIGGDSIAIDTQGDPSTWTFNFATTGQAAFSLLHSPLLSPTRLLVRGLGANAGRTSLIRLDPNKWADDPALGGYRYTDLAGSQGGVESIVLGPGSLSIFAQGVNWPWNVAGAQDQVWVDFELGEELFCAEFDAGVASANGPGQFVAGPAPAPGACPEPVCGNGLHELGEECDDGNFDNGDGCTDQCLVAECTATEYASTWEAIQSKVIGQTSADAYQCQFCHGPVPVLNTLDLSPASAYANLVGVPAANFFTDHDLIEPGEPSASFFYEKLAAGTNATLLPSGQGVAMPNVGLPLTPDHLEAVSKWIRAGAPETGVVEGTASLLAAVCPRPRPRRSLNPIRPPRGRASKFFRRRGNCRARAKTKSA